MSGCSPLLAQISPHGIPSRHLGTVFRHVCSDIPAGQLFMNHASSAACQHHFSRDHPGSLLCQAPLPKQPRATWLLRKMRLKGSSDTHEYTRTRKHTHASTGVRTHARKREHGCAYTHARTPVCEVERLEGHKERLEEHEERLACVHLSAQHAPQRPNKEVTSTKAPTPVTTSNGFMAAAAVSLRGRNGGGVLPVTRPEA